MQSSRDFIIQVHDLKDLVVAPALDPFSDYKPECQAQAAIHLSIRKWDTEGRYAFSTVQIHLPNNKLQTLDKENTRQMLHRYFEEQLAENKENLLLFRKNIFRTFRNAILFLCGCMGVVTMINTPTIMPPMPVVRGVLTEGLTVIGWVVFRRPVESVLYDLNVYHNKKAIYQKLLKADIQFVANDTF